MNDMHLEPGFNDKKELVEISLVSGKPPFGPAVKVNIPPDKVEGFKKVIKESKPGKIVQPPTENFPLKRKVCPCAGEKVFQAPRIEKKPGEPTKISKIDRTKFKK